MEQRPYFLKLLKLLGLKEKYNVTEKCNIMEINQDPNSDIYRPNMIDVTNLGYLYDIIRKILNSDNITFDCDNNNECSIRYSDNDCCAQHRTCTIDNFMNNIVVSKLNEMSKNNKLSSFLTENKKAIEIAELMLENRNNVTIIPYLTLGENKNKNKSFDQIYEIRRGVQRCTLGGNLCGNIEEFEPDGKFDTFNDLDQAKEAFKLFSRNAYLKKRTLCYNEKSDVDEEIFISNKLAKDYSNDVKKESDKLPLFMDTDRIKEVYNAKKIFHINKEGNFIVYNTTSTKNITCCKYPIDLNGTIKEIFNSAKTFENFQQAVRDLNITAEQDPNGKGKIIDKMIPKEDKTSIIESTKYDRNVHKVLVNTYKNFRKELASGGGNIEKLKDHRRNFLYSFFVSIVKIFGLIKEDQTRSYNSFYGKGGIKSIFADKDVLSNTNMQQAIVVDHKH